MEVKMDEDLVKCLIKNINKMIEGSQKEIKIMEVCGTHTQMISKLGLRNVLSSKIKLLSGPGCPVCVTDELYIDTAIDMLNKYSIVIVTFGDLMKVRGTRKSLMDEKSTGRDIRIIYSPLDLIELAADNKDKNFVFLGVGFETTAPVIALAIKTAKEKQLKNLFFLTSLKLMNPILHYILRQSDNQVDAFICPGHVASIKGSEYFKFITEKYNIPAAVCGFEALDIVLGVHYLVEQIINNDRKHFNNLYKRCVSDKGNCIANNLMKEVFDTSNSEWRGIGKIDNSGLIINEKYFEFDALKKFAIESVHTRNITRCECRDILLGNKSPMECKLFSSGCNPLKPYGACMVSSEGACSIAYRYKDIGL
jgi:hydrogenase expression/formation protein HypD